jgi:tetratricopeptide (TPR) repeat protein
MYPSPSAATGQSQPVQAPVQQTDPAILNGKIVGRWTFAGNVAGGLIGAAAVVIAALIGLGLWVHAHDDGKKSQTQPANVVSIDSHNTSDSHNISNPKTFNQKTITRIVNRNTTRIFSSLPVTNNDGPVKRRAAELYNRGATLQQLGNDDAAVIDFRAAIALNPLIPWAHNNIGVAFIHKLDAQDAIDQYNQEIAYYPNEANPHFNLAIALGFKGDEERSIRENQIALALSPKDTFIRDVLALAYLERYNVPVSSDKLEEAQRLGFISINSGINEIKQSLVDDPNDAYAYSLLGLASFLRAELEGVKRMVAADKKDAVGSEAARHASDNDFAAIQPNLDKALSLGPADPHVQLTVARTYAIGGKSAKALAALKIACSLDPTLIPQLSGQADFAILEGEPDFKVLVASRK